MNKEKAIKEIKKASESIYACDYIKTKVAESIISQIDQPQKVVVPQFVAEWLKYFKKKGCTLLYALNHINHDDELRLYINQQEGDYTETLARAWLDYLNITVEKEKLYTVEIPDPHGIYKISYLLRNSEGYIRIGGSDYSDIFLNVETHLTESEIKKDFEWAWQWAKPVEEN